MAWTRIINQDRVVRTLTRSLLQGRVAHAYLFHGPPGAGKRAVALEMARALECKSAAAEACEACDACRKTRRMVHPDVHVVLPHPWSQEADRDEEDMGKRVQRMGDNPYAAIDYVRRPSLSDPSATSNKQVLFRIEQVRQDLIRPMTLSKGEGAYKVAIVIDAERMNTESANTFLKMLEEPPPQTVFLLLTSRPDTLLPTIVSRCQKVRFDPLAPEALAQALQKREGIAADTANMLARMADGSYSRALELHANDDLRTSRSLVLHFFRAAFTYEVGTLADLVQEMSRQGRVRLQSILRLMLRWIRDLVLYRTLGDEAPLVNVDQAAAIARFCRNLPKADLDTMAALVEEALEMVGRNVRAPLVLHALAAALHRAMRGRPVDGLYAPLSHASAY
jgi:DNA polymerase-3 subunit delta'